MANLDEWRIRWLLAGVGCGSFVLLLVLEIVTEEDAISPLDLMVDAVTILLTISAAGASPCWRSVCRPSTRRR